MKGVKLVQVLVALPALKVQVSSSGVIFARLNLLHTCCLTLKFMSLAYRPSNDKDIFVLHDLCSLLKTH